ncbi:sensor histidine kinase [Albidovulum sp.]
MSEPGGTAPHASRPRPLWRSVRVRLLVLALLPLLLLMPLLLATAVKSWNDLLAEVLIARVGGELTIAHQHFTGLAQSRGERIAALAASVDFDRARDRGALRELLALKRGEIGLDFLYYLPPSGPIVASPDGAAPADPGHWPVVQAALAGQARNAIDIFSARQLAAISPELAERARIALVPTRAAAPTTRAEETRGMVMHAAAPARGGALVGGVLLNRNLSFIDEINELVYPADRLRQGSRGTATLFLDDVRISTNVRLFAEKRALGTRVSQIVRDRVLGEGRVWLDRAFVVNDWYVSAYEPVSDSFGRRVGMLYVGFLEAPFARARRDTLLQIGGVALGVVLVFVPILLRAARGIFRPLEEMNGVITRVEAGDLAARIAGPLPPDEIGRVAEHLDHLLDQVEARDRELRAWAEELERRVAERTRDLEEANRRLEATTRQLIVSEKLAAIGEITAGVAHEINNPLAVIQGNFDVLRSELGAAGREFETEFRLIQDQIQAIHILVSKLLQFARPEEYAESGEGHDPDAVIRDTLPLVMHLLTRSHVEMVLDLDAGATVAINRTELQQVMVNLIVNAVQAMPEGGTLTIRTRREADGAGARVRITVEDTGIGMAEEVAARIFDPFFTTKRGEGTGLGLSISRNLIARAGGTIEIASRVGEGTRFDILLPARATEMAAGA